MKTVATFTLAFLLTSSAAYAGATVYKIAGVCGWDMQQYCKGIPPKKIRELRACLAKHEKELFGRCQDHYKEAVP
jgi:hypothetical protein